MSTSISENAGRRVHQCEHPPVPAADGDIWIRGKVGHPTDDVFIRRKGAWSHRDDGDLNEITTYEMKLEAKKAKLKLARDKMLQDAEERKARDTPQSSVEDAW